jgi:hypothetical protein
MLALGHQDLESLEAISQDELTRRLFLRMAALSQGGQLEPFIREMQEDEDLDAETRVALKDLAADTTFLFAVQDYLQRTHLVH